MEAEEARRDGGGGRNQSEEVEVAMAFWGTLMDTREIEREILSADPFPLCLT